jgi:hypothetical protein
MPIRENGTLPKIRSVTCGHWSDSLSRFRHERRCVSARRCSRPYPLNWKWRSNPSPNIGRSAFSQVKEDLFPPIPQAKRSLSLVMPHAVYWSLPITTVGAILLLALHLGGAWGPQGGVLSESLGVRSVTTATIAELNERALIALACLSQSGVRDNYLGPKYGLSIAH